MNKKIKKIIVNGLTLSRVLATISMPILFSFLSTGAFLLLIGGVLLTDAIDGFLARHWDVSTIFGSFFDMSADKVLGVSILFILTFSYPLMWIPLGLELCIGKTNVLATLKGGKGVSSSVGKVKTWVMGLSVFSLLLIGAAPELTSNLNNINMNNMSSEFIKLTKENVLKVLEFIKNNENGIKNVAITSTVLADTVTLFDYKKEYDKVKDNEKLLKKEDLIKYREYIKKIIFDEKYYKETKDLPLYEKIIPLEKREEVKVKRLVNKNS